MISELVRYGVRSRLICTYEDRVTNICITVHFVIDVVFRLRKK